jgi:tetratricopeptide (TPR) repeat protein
MNPHLERAQILLSQSRPELAEKELRAAILLDTQDAVPHAYLALALTEQEKHADAEKEANLALHLDPENSFPFYVKACVHQAQKRHPDAKNMIDHAISMDPDEAAYYSLLSGILLAQKKWAMALEAAEKGLEIEPEHAGCNNYRALALTKLGREEEARDNLDSVLASDPENALSHANMGWALLHQGNYDQSAIHFREALRIDPQLEWAREGMVEALKGKRILYRIFLRYLLWMSKFKGRTQWVLIIGVYIGMRIMRGISRSSPGLSLYLQPVLLVATIFILFTWLASPIFNLLLRLDPLGKWALSKDQIRGANAVGICLSLAIVGGVMIAMNHPLGFTLTIGSILLSLPISAVFTASHGKYRNVLAGVSALLTLLFFVLLFSLYVGHPVARNLTPIFFLACFASTWLANIAILRSS